MATVSNTPAATLRKLFGGAMECLLPAAYIDVSDLRQVPDHQEAFVSWEDGIGIIIEVLSYETEISSELGGDGNGASARHFFDDLAAANGAASSACDYCADLSDSIMPELSSYSKAALAGRQTVAKFRGDGPAEAVRLYLVNVRLPNVRTDLLITVNVPYPDEPAAARSMASAECFCSSDAPPPPQQQQQQRQQQRTTTTTSTDVGAGVVVGAGSSETAAAAAAVAAARSAGAQTPPTVSVSAAAAVDGGTVASDTPPAQKYASRQTLPATVGAPLTSEEALLPAGGGGGPVVSGAQEEDSAGGGGAGARGAGGSGDNGRPLPSSGEGDGDDGDDSSAGDAGVAALRSLLHSFSILDWSLFG